jgi:dethiobiotin synthetase
MNGLFIAGTGTDIGKTFVACGLIRALRSRGIAANALKPVASGFSEHDLAASDAGRLVEALGRPSGLEEIARISPWRFEAPLSPDMAARREARAIDFDALVDFTRRSALPPVTLVEGVGGAMVPLDDEHTTLDWMAAVEFPVALVTGSYLGTLSHTLTAVGALHHAGLSVVALVVSETPGSTVELDETARTLARFTELETVVLPRDAARHAVAFATLAATVGPALGLG